MSVRFSILMPAYNRENYVRQAVDSVLSQSFKSVEVIVVDDGSTDGTLQILKSYGDTIQVLQQQNQGPEVARNKAASCATGEYLIMLDSDDVLLPGALALYDRIIRAFDHPALVIGSLFEFYDGDRLPEAHELTDSPKVLKFSSYLAKNIRIDLFTSMIVMRRSVFQEIGGFRNTTPKTFHLDGFNLILKSGTYGPCIVVRQPYTVGYRKHATNSLKNLKAIADGIVVLARTERRGEYPGGSRGLWGRYAFIGGIATAWAIKFCWRGGEKKLALSLLAKTAPMAAVAISKKVTNSLRKSPAPETISI